MTDEEPDSVAIPCLLFKRPDLQVNGTHASDTLPCRHNLAADAWSFEPLRALVPRPDFDAWLDSDPKRHSGAFPDEFVWYVGWADYDAVQFPSLAKSVLLDSGIPEFPEFKALELAWTFVYYTFHQDLLPDEKYDYPAREAARFNIGTMMIHDSPEKQWRSMLHSSFQSWGISLATTDSRGRTFLHYLANLRTEGGSDPKTLRTARVSSGAAPLPGPQPRYQR